MKKDCWVTLLLTFINFSFSNEGVLPKISKISEKNCHSCHNNFHIKVNKTLWERILGHRCIRHIGMYISWEFACTSVQGLMIESTEY